jgi:pyrroloquinoline quinone (PQQ) biosynthesis protein C
LESPAVSQANVERFENDMQTLDTFRSLNIQRLNGTRLVQDILNNRLNKNHYVGYLINVFNYAKHSPKVIALAASRCINSHPVLATYLLQHAGEEIGHEAWAMSDLKDLGLKEQAIKESRPVPACTSMIALEYYAAGVDNPVSLFGWLYALESLGDAIAPMVSKSIGRALESDGKSIYFLEGHGEADHQHTADLEAQITKNVSSPKDLDDIFNIAQISSELYARMLNEISERNEQWLS